MQIIQFVRLTKAWDLESLAGEFAGEMVMGEIQGELSRSESWNELVDEPQVSVLQYIPNRFVVAHCAHGQHEAFGENPRNATHKPCNAASADVFAGCVFIYVAHGISYNGTKRILVEGNSRTHMEYNTVSDNSKSGPHNLLPRRLVRRNSNAD